MIGKLTQVCLQLLLLPSFLFYSFKSLICLSMTPEKVCAAEASDREGTGLSSNSAAVSNGGREVQSWYWEWHWAASRKREIHFFHFLMCLSPSLSPMSFCWNPLQEDMACSAWVGKPLEMKVNLKSFCRHWLPPAENCFESGQLLKTLSTYGRFSVPVSGQYSLHKKAWSHVISWYYPCIIPGIHGLLQSLVSFWLLLLFQEFLCSVITPI